MAGKLVKTSRSGVSGFGLLFAMVIVLMGCAAPGDPGWQQPASIANTWVYQCDPDYRFVARQEQQQLWLFLPRRTLALKPVYGGEGYSGEGYSLMREGDTAVLSFEGDSYHCRNDRRAAIWEASKLNGYDYRAVGNEPGWYLEIGQGMMSRLVTQYGQSRLDFSLPEPRLDSAARLTLYRVPEQALEIRIEGRVCRDSMSGETFASTVAITWQGQAFSGCGRALH
ncbi:hypothetical protein MIB92_17765 [Aestuariirhabdus sp. Z084]|uniref:hypothetical protein n=1 Tax=Aestuariirhabdus haliotis TaxID=2918751 RepID=UPI00201B40C8|nr:hypothetical protein [Aestuariirhabdus haliotis]MCL6417513.1 hypothetical protein [Aestuariirhabdus haliotis]MCL6421443.1 hypothetical protein [Aestuariirhabdus haliotis]